MYCERKEIFKQINTYDNTLFHFTKLDSAIKILSTNSFRFGKLKDMNDIAESNLSIIGEWVNKDEQNQAELEISKYQILSLTRDYPTRRGYEQTSLWGYYAEKGMGACIVFNKKKLINAFEQIDNSRKHHRHIDYHKKLTGTSFLDRNKYYSVEDDIWRNKVSLFFGKHIGWSHEKEYRFIVKAEDDVYINEISSAIVAIIICTLQSTAKQIKETKRYTELTKVCGNIPILCYQQNLGNNELVCYECDEQCPMNDVGELDIKYKTF